MTGIRRFRRKPVVGEEDQHAAAFRTRGPLDDLLAVARMADPGAEAEKVRFRAETVLLVRWHDMECATARFEVARDGDYLAFSQGTHRLYTADEANWRQFYDEVT